MNVRTGLFVGTCLAVIWSGGAFAQAPAPGMGSEPQADPGRAAAADENAEIVVVAQKRAEKLQDVPIAITAIGAEQLSAAGVTSTDELPMLSPGLGITMAGGQIMPSIRGVGQTGTTITLENPIAIYVDGVYYASPAGGLFSLNNIQQVAVLKGPQGTLFGRNATGGLIQITTRDPSSTFGGEADLTVGNRETYGGSLYVTGPLSTNVSADLAVRYNNQSKGFGKNRFTGKDVNDLEDLNIRSKLKVELSDSTTIRMAGDYAHTRAGQPAYRIVETSVPAFPNAPYPPSVGKFDVYSNFDPLSKIEQWGGSLTVEHRFDFATLTSITAYRRTTLDMMFDTDAGPAPGGATVGQNEKQFTQELQLVSSTRGPLQWTAGAYYFDNRGFYDPPVHVFLPVNLNLPFLPGLPISQILFHGRPKAVSVAGYLQGTYALTDKLNFTAGIRYTWEKRKISGSQTLIPAVVPITIPIPDSKRRTEERPTWRLALDYRFSDQALGYLSYNRGFKSGGFNPTELPYTEFKAEVIDAYETGLKLDLLDRRLRINPSFYYYKYDNLQVVNFTEGTQKTRNAARATIYGVDLDATARVSKQFEMTVGFAWIHGRYDEFNGALFWTPQSQANGGGNTLSVGSAKGKKIANTPDWTINVGANYVIPLGSDELVLNGTYYHSDGWYAEPENRRRQPSYDLVNLSAAYRMGDSLEFSVWGRNLGNVAYARRLYSSTPGDIVARAAGRTFGATAGVKF
ncbi:MAG TPA: TonB-dependent receptor [Allosphingosinicella sp.]|nr:TonB-dependent receptor [Allosphingosinicella sp.]